MRFSLFLTPLFALPFCAAAQTANFDLVLDNKVIGKDTYTLGKARQGYRVSSRFSFRVHEASGDFLDEYTFKEGFALLSASRTNNDTLMMTSFLPNKDWTELTIAHSQNGQSDSGFFAIKPDFFLLPPFDAGAVQALLLAATSPGGRTAFNLYVPPPVAVSSAPGRGAPSPAFDATWSAGPASSGTLEGKPVDASSYILTAQGFRWIIYADGERHLLECDLPVAKTRYVRKGFVLSTSALGGNPGN